MEEKFTQSFSCHCYKCFSLDFETDNYSPCFVCISVVVLQLSRDTQRGADWSSCFRSSEMTLWVRTAVHSKHQRGEQRNHYITEKWWSDHKYWKPEGFEKNQPQKKSSTEKRYLQLVSQKVVQKNVPLVCLDQFYSCINVQERFLILRLLSSKWTYNLNCKNSEKLVTGVLNSCQNRYQFSDNQLTD